MYGHRLVRELLGLLFLFCGLLMLLSLWSYHVGDPTFNQAVSIQASSVQNAAGLFGAYLAGFLVDSFGLGSFLWVVFFLSVGAGLVSRWLVLKWYRWVGYVLLFACALVTASSFNIEMHGIQGGGLTGKWLSAFSLIFFSPSGSLLLWLFVFLIAMELSFSISWLTLCSRLIAWLFRKIPSFGTTFDLPVPHMPDAVRRMGSLVGRMGRRSRDRERPRPVLDIVLGRKEEAAPAALELRVDEHPSEKNAASETGAVHKEEGLEDILRLVEQPREEKNTASDASDAAKTEAAQAVSSSPAPVVISEEEEGDFILELDDPVESPAAPAPVDSAASVRASAVSATPASAPVESAPVASEESNSSATEEEKSGETEDIEELQPSALAALSASASSGTEDFPAVVVSSQAEKPRPFAEQVQEEADLPKKDEGYASVDTAVAGAMALQKELAAAPAPQTPARRISRTH